MPNENDFIEADRSRAETAPSGRLDTPARTVDEIAGFDVADRAMASLFHRQIEYMWLDDLDATLVTLATAVSCAIEDGEPLWLMLVGPSSGGKGESLRIIDDAVHQRVKDLTLAGLLTRTQGKNPRTVGLLTELQGRNEVMSITDFSALLTGDSRSGTTKLEVFNALRDIYDGAYSRTMNGGVASWEGRLTLVAACTPAIDRFGAHSDSLGTRWLYYRLPQRDGESRRLVSQMARRRTGLGEKRDRAAEAARAVIEAARRRAPDIALNDELDELVVDAALVASYGRADVPRENWGSRDITDAVVAEEPGRVTHQLDLLARSLLALNVREDRVSRVVKRTALGSMPAGRASVLRVLAGRKDPVSTNQVAAESGLNYKVAERTLEDLQAIGLAEDSGCSHGATDPHGWSLDPEHAQVVRRLGTE